MSHLHVIANRPTSNETLWKYLDCDGQERSGSDIPTRRPAAPEPKPEPQDDGLGAARGIILALPIGVIAWTILYLCIRILRGCL